MKLIYMNGGLGNQLFQYIFYRAIELNTGDECIIDDTYFTLDPDAHNGYEVEKIFGLKPKLLSRVLSPEQWAGLLECKIDGKTVNQLDYLNTLGYQFELCSEGNTYTEAYKDCDVKYDKNYFTLSMNSFNGNVFSLPGDIFYYGYWINPHWFHNIRETIVKDLTFPEITDEHNQKIMDSILSTNSVGIHIRRGDFVTLGWALGPDWYAGAVRHMRNVIMKPTFFVFSDDIPWCRENFAQIGFEPTDEIVYVEGNMGGGNFRDMHHMTMCKNLVISNSSFSYLAGLLNQTPNKYIINPSSQREMF